MHSIHPDYTIIKELGRGSSATVYLAVQNHLNRRVALKVFSRPFSDTVSLARFKREALILARLEHPHIVPIFELAEAPVSHCLIMAMRYLNGGTLREKLPELTLGDCVDITIDLAAALAYAHRNGYVHRDIKPDNVLFDQGKPLLTDFGIARATESQTYLTQTGAMIGTPAYMSPEQLNDGILDGRSDLYSLGIMLYEMLTGTRPYESDSAVATGIMHITANIPPLPESLSALQPCLDKLLDKNPANRMPDADTLVAELCELQENSTLTLDRKIESLAAGKLPRTSLSSSTSPERRQVTIACIDIPDIAHLSARLDPEDMHDVMDLVKQTTDRIVLRYRGSISQLLNSGMVVYFGYPAAHEDDGRRAVHASLEIVKSLKDMVITHLEVSGLNSQIGVHTGPVVVGGDAAVTSDKLVTGRTPAIAGRLARDAGMGEVVISEATSNLMQGVFKISPVVVEVGSTDNAQAVNQFLVHGVVTTETRYSAAHDSTPAEPVGRDTHIQWLLKSLRQAGTGNGKAMLLSGEAGIGKSCLANYLINVAKAENSLVLLYQCSPYHTDSAFYPVIRQLMHASGFDPASTAADNLDRLFGALNLPVAAQADCAGLIAGSLQELEDEFASRFELVGVNAQQRRDRSLDLLIKTLARAALQNPVLIVLEDAHWIDPTTGCLLEKLTSIIDKLPVMILITARPEFDAGFLDKESPDVLKLSRLKDHAIMQIVRATDGREVLQQNIVESITDKAGGIPLYAQEISKSMLDYLSTNKTSRTINADALMEQFPVPATLQDSLIARLDGMREIKQVAQAAACIGREFHRDLVSALLPVSTDDLSSALGALVNADIIARSSPSDSGSYLFQHALLRDAAYTSLTRTTRRQHHASALAYMAASGGYPTEILAHHATESQQLEEALRYWETAGINAAENAAYTEAISHYDKAISCAQQLDDSTATRMLELNVVVKKGHASTAINGFAHPLTVETNFAARALLDQVGDTEYRFPVLYGHWIISHALGNHPVAITDAVQMADEAARTSERVQLMIAQRVQSASQTMMGHFAGSIEHCRRFLSLYDEKHDRGLAWQYGSDPHVATTIYQSLCLIIQGRITEASRLHDELEAFARSLDHMHTLVYALSHLALTQQVGRLSGREQPIHETNDLVEEHNMLAYKGHSVGIHAMYLFDQGKIDESLSRMTESLEIINKTKTFIYTPVMYGYYSACLAALGKANESTEALYKALSMVSANGEKWALPEIHRVIGESAFRYQNDVDTAIEQAETAINTAKELKAHLWRLRASVLLAEIWLKSGKPKKARPLLLEALELIPMADRHCKDCVDASELLLQLDELQDHPGQLN